MSRSQWIDYVKLGTLVQGGRSLLICSSRVGRHLVMLKEIGREVDHHRGKLAKLRHRYIENVNFFIATETDSYLAFQYVRYTLKELLPRDHYILRRCSRRQGRMDLSGTQCPL
jgi:hypothetical protein